LSSDCGFSRKALGAENKTDAVSDDSEFLTVIYLISVLSESSFSLPVRRLAVFSITPFEFSGSSSLGPSLLGEFIRFLLRRLDWTVRLWLAPTSTDKVTAGYDGVFSMDALATSCDVALSQTGHRMGRQLRTRTYGMEAHVML
jgi:hypothetical protein